MQSRARDPYFVALFEAAKALNSSLELDEVLHEIARNSAEALGVRASSLRLVESSGRLLSLVASYGLSEDYLAKGPVSRQSSDIDRRALRGETVVVLDAPTDHRFQYQAAAREEGFKSVLCVPVLLEGRGIGVLRVYAWERRPFNQGEADLLTAMATLGAIAIRNAETFGRVRNHLHDLEQFVTATW